MEILPDNIPRSLLLIMPPEPMLSCQLLPKVALSKSSVTASEAGGLILTVVLALAEPAVPVQVRVKVEVEVRLPVDSEPEVALVPLQAPEAVHDVVLVELQVRVEAEPEVTEVGEAERETVGVVPVAVVSKAPTGVDVLLLELRSPSWFS